MPRKINQTYNFESPDNKLDKYHKTRYYPAFWGANQQKKLKQLYVIIIKP